MRAQGIISDIVLNVRRAKQHFTFSELFGMMQGTQVDEVNWEEFSFALKLVVATGEVKSTLPVYSTQFADCAIFCPGKMR
jgi:hypothetical protein